MPAGAADQCTNGCMCDLMAGPHQNACLHGDDSRGMQGPWTDLWAAVHAAACTAPCACVGRRCMCMPRPLPALCRHMRVWLIEVNSSPSLAMDTPLDRAVKPRVVADVLRLLSPLAFDRAALAEVLRARQAGRAGALQNACMHAGTVWMGPLLLAPLLVLR